MSPLFNWGHIVEEIDQRVAVKVAAERAQLDERIQRARLYGRVIDEALDQYDKDVDDKIAKAVTEALRKANQAHRNELDAERVRHKNESLTPNGAQRANRRAFEIDCKRADPTRRPRSARIAEARS